MTHRCPKCNRVIAKEDRRYKRQGTLQPMNGSIVTIQPKQAAQVRCPTCNHVTILLKGVL